MTPIVKPRLILRYDLPTKCFSPFPKTDSEVYWDAYFVHPWFGM